MGIKNRIVNATYNKAVTRLHQKISIPEDKEHFCALLSPPYSMTWAEWETNFLGAKIPMVHRKVHKGIGVAYYTYPRGTIPVIAKLQEHFVKDKGKSFTLELDYDEYTKLVNKKSKHR